MQALLLPLSCHHGTQEAGVQLAGEAGDIMASINRHGNVVLEGSVREEAPSLAASTAAEGGPAWPRRTDAALNDLRSDADAAFSALELQDPSQLFGVAAAAPAANSSSAGLTAARTDLQAMLARPPQQARPHRASASSAVRELAQAGIGTLAAREPAEAGGFPHVCACLLICGSSCASSPALIPAVRGVLLASRACALVWRESLTSASRCTTAGQTPSGQQSRLRQQILVVNELLRHFWASVPCSTPAREQKAKRMADECLSRRAAITSILDQAGHNADTILAAAHAALQSIQAAHERYTSEQARHAASHHARLMIH